MLINDFLILLCIPKQDKEISSCSRYGLSLPGRGQVLVRCSHTITGLRTTFLFLQFLDLLLNSLAPFTLYFFGYIIIKTIMHMQEGEWCYVCRFLNFCIFLPSSSGASQRKDLMGIKWLLFA